MDDDLGLLSSASSVTSVTCSSSINNAGLNFNTRPNKSHQSCDGLKHLPSHQHESGKIIKSLQSNHKTFYSEDYDTELSSICNMAKVKISKQHEIGFLNLLNECQAWIEVIKNREHVIQRQLKFILKFF